MIITLVKANFSSSNIGTSTTWVITPNVGSGASYSGVTSVTKGAALNATVTIKDGYELGSAGVTVTMGGVTQSGVYSISGKTITISIGNVTGNVVIKVPTVNSSTGEEEGGGNVNTDTEIGTATTLGSDNTSVTIIDSFNKFTFVKDMMVSTGGGSSCILKNGTGRATSTTQVLKITGGATLKFNPVISGLQWAVVEFKDKPCTVSNFTPNGQKAASWITNDITTQTATKYIVVNFNNSSSTSFTPEQLELLKTAITIS